MTPKYYMKCKSTQNEYPQLYLQEELTWSNKTTLNYQNEMEKREIVLIDKDLPIIKCLNSEA